MNFVHSYSKRFSAFWAMVFPKFLKEELKNKKMFQICIYFL